MTASARAWRGSPRVNNKWTAHWTTLLGIRNDTVWTNAGPVSGYSDMYSMDADAFNALNRARTDIDIDVTTLARYEPNAHTTFEMGYARKTRAPNLYERYAWSTDWMTSGMINWFGDGNYYVGNVDLKPEVAHTVSGTASWHDRTRKEWEIKVTPYQTYVRDYIDVERTGHPDVRYEHVFATDVRESQCPDLGRRLEMEWRPSGRARSMAVANSREWEDGCTAGGWTRARASIK